MAVTHSATLRNSLCNLAVDALDPSGNLVFKTAAGTIAATLPLAATAAAAAIGGTAVFTKPTDDSSATGNVSAVTKFELRDSGNDAQILGSVTVTGGGGDIELSSIVINAGDTVTVSALTYSAPA